MDNLTDLLEEQLKDIYNAENQLLKALPRMAKFATTEELKMAFQQHTEETRAQIERLDQVAQMLDVKPTGKVCAAMKGLIEEGKEVMEEDGHSGVLDAALIAAAQRVEHYEIAAYGTVRAIAQQLGLQDVADIFEEILKEEEATDEKLTQVAESSIYNLTPKTEGDMSEDDEEGSGGGGGRGGSSRSSKKTSKKSSKSSGRSSGGGGNRPPSRAAASKGGKNSGGGKGGKKTSRSSR